MIQKLGMHKIKLQKVWAKGTFVVPACWPAACHGHLSACTCPLHSPLLRPSEQQPAHIAQPPQHSPLKLCSRASRLLSLSSPSSPSLLLLLSAPGCCASCSPPRVQGAEMGRE